MPMYQPEIETMPRDQLKKLQGERLCKQVQRMYARVSLFRRRMQEAGLDRKSVV